MGSLHGHSRVNRAAKSYLDQLCTDTEWSLEDLRMNGRDERCEIQSEGERERERERDKERERERDRERDRDREESQGTLYSSNDLMMMMIKSEKEKRIS